ncbi:ZBT12 protein, partial [Alopecoenas beccarii]|nr:ZBT12 protein [Alopecoenas beccarii]
MSSCPELLRFQLPGHEAAALRSMNRLRAEERFCDVTIVARSLRFRGHRVILAACSPFLRDQFLLNPAAELRVSLAHSARVLADLLLSCYTGALEFAGRDLVNYLTAASYLQMEHVVERCRGALARFIQAPPPVKGDEGEDEDEDAAGDVCIVKVEPARRKRRESWAGPGGVAAPHAPPPLGVVKACYSLAEDAEGEGLLIFPSGGGGELNRGALGGADDAVGNPDRMGDDADRMGDNPDRMGDNADRMGDNADRMGDNAMGAMAAAPSASPAPSSSSSSAPARCGKCGDHFQGVEKLVFHMRAQHFVFMCPRCGKQFNHSSNLNRHMNVHRGVKSHGCGVCGKSFTQKSTLHDHMNLHSGERPYRCSYCDVRFAHKPAIRRHLKEQHGKTTAENVLEAGGAEGNGNVMLR